MSNPPYDVGYKKPPQISQFKKGTSGNPKGRPKGSKNTLEFSYGDERLKALLLEEAYRGIPIQDSGKSITIPIAQAIIRSLSVAAAKGNTRAQRLFLETLGAIENEQTNQVIECNRALMDYKFQWEEEIEAARIQGRPLPDPVPHPKDIHIDFKRGRVSIRGPRSKEERAQIEDLRARKKSFLEEVAYCKKELANPKCKYKEFVQKELDSAQKIVDIISTVIKD